MKTLMEYLQFKRYMMPAVLQILFWGGIGGVLYGSWWLFTHDNWAWTLSLVFGTLITRLVFESFIIRYQSFKLLKDIKDKLYEKP